MNIFYSILLSFILLTQIQANPKTGQQETGAKAEKLVFQTVSLSGNISLTEKEDKNGRVRRYYYLEAENGMKIRLPKSKLKKEKGDDGKMKQVADLEKLVDQNVKVEFIGKPTKNGYQVKEILAIH
ncbi:MAG: hypothetical protein MK193_01825 [Lentisphaeria bacterium]|nr:hypothetical protein [Lentisphaeria bacterium]